MIAAPPPLPSPPETPYWFCSQTMPSFEVADELFQGIEFQPIEELSNFNHEKTMYSYKSN